MILHAIYWVWLTGIEAWLTNTVIVKAVILDVAIGIVEVGTVIVQVTTSLVRFSG